jgi:benzodiazapine receptor
MTSQKFFRLLGSLALPLFVGGTSGFFTSGAIHAWYTTVTKPSFNPPDYLFAPVWTILYILMGVSFYLIYEQSPGPGRVKALRVYLFQLFLNFWWSFIFFYLERIDLAVVEILMLWLSIIWMIVVFYRVKPLAAYLQIPYLLWVTFAAVLNGALLQLNWYKY